MIGITRNTLFRRAFNVLILAFAMFVQMTSASAGGALPLPKIMSHRTQARQASFYVDAGIGIDIFSSPFTHTTYGFTGAAFDNNMTHAGRMINSAPSASLGFGYVFPINRWFNLGARVFVRYANNFSSENEGEQANLGTFVMSGSSSVELRNFEYGVDLTPGVNIGVNQFLNGIFGLAFNQARLRTTDVLIFGGLGPQDPGTVQNSLRRDVVGVRLGYRLEELLSRYLGVTMSYIWTGYGSVHILTSTPIAFRGDSGTNIQTHNIMVGLKYYFSPQHYVRGLRSMANAFDRFYLQFAVGNLIPQIQSSANVTYSNTISNVQRGTQNASQGAPAPLGVLGLGYGFLIHHFYIGLEALMSAADRTGKSDQSLISPSGRVDQFIRLHLNTVEGAFDLKLGRIIAPEALVFVRTGVAYNHIQMINFASQSPFLGVFAIVRQSVSKEVVGFRFGLGLEKLFSDNVALTMNYVYTYYGHISGSALSTPVIPNTLSNADARVGTHAVTLGVNYYFG